MLQFDLIGALPSWLSAYGPLLLGVVAFCCALGLPLPMPALVFANGALLRDGGHGGAAYQLASALGCVAGSLAGESIFYLAGRQAGVLARVRPRRLLAGAWVTAQTMFSARAARAVYLTRFLLTPLGIPTSLIAGSQHYAYWRFAACAIAGDLVWILGYGTAGYLLGPQWQVFNQAAGRYGLLALPLTLVALGCSALWQRRARDRQALTGATGPAGLTEQTTA